MTEHKYIAIDLKSFYASVECVDRGLDPLTANLVVADKNRTEKTICLAVSPSLKKYGISGRARLFEVMQRVGEINFERLNNSPEHKFSGKSVHSDKLSNDPSLELDFIAAPPKMSHYIEVSNRIYEIYLRYIAPEDIHVYSIDEVFIDATKYLKTYKMSAYDLTKKIIREVFLETGITATAGIGTNLYLCKVAMDIVAKHTSPDEDGVRIAELDEFLYRLRLWDYQPLTDFWRVGSGYLNKLSQHGIFTMGDIARCSVYNESLLYELFGVNAELLIDHAWGWEPCTISDIKSYRPESHSVSTGQVLSTPYSFEKAELIVTEMTELLALDLVDKRLVTNQIVLTVGYDIDNVKTKIYKGSISTDHYGRAIPRHAHGSESLNTFTASSKLLVDAVLRLFGRIVDKNLLVRRMYVVASNTIDETEMVHHIEQYDLFSNLSPESQSGNNEAKALEREKSLQKTMVYLHKHYGKNSVLKGLNFRKGGTTISRNGQIGGHRA